MGAYLYLVTGPILLLLEIVSKGLVEATNFGRKLWMNWRNSLKQKLCISECKDSPPRVPVADLRRLIVSIAKPKKSI